MEDVDFTKPVKRGPGRPKKTTKATLAPAPKKTTTATVKVRNCHPAQRRIYYQVPNGELQVAEPGECLEVPRGAEKNIIASGVAEYVK